MVSCIVNSTVTFWVNHRWISTIVQKMLQAAVIKRRHKMQRVLRIAAFNSGAFQHKCFPTNKLSQFTECDALITLVTVRCRRGKKKNKTKKNSQVWLLCLILIILMVSRKMTINSEKNKKYFNIHFLEVNWTRMRFFFLLLLVFQREQRAKEKARGVFQPAEGLGGCRVVQRSTACLVRLVDLSASAHQGHSALVPPISSRIVQRCPIGRVKGNRTQ